MNGRCIGTMASMYRPCLCTVGRQARYKTDAQGSRADIRLIPAQGTIARHENDWTGMMPDHPRADEALEALPHPVVLFDDTGRFCLCNRAFEALASPGGAPHGVDDIASLAVALAPDDPEASEALSIAIRSFRQDHEVQGRNGHPLLVSTTPTRSGGRLVTLVPAERLSGQTAIFGDLSRALAGSNIGIIVWDEQLRIQVVNDAWCDMAVPTEVGAHLRGHAHDLLASARVPMPDGMTHAAAADAYVAAVFAGPLFVEGIHPDGRIVQYRGFPLTQGGVAGFCFDVTEARTAERTARALLEEMVESLEEGVGLYDADLILRMSNTALHRHAHGDAPPLPVGSTLAEYCAYVLELGTVALPEGVGATDFHALIEDAVRSHRRGLVVAMSDGRSVEVSSFPTAAGGYLLSMRDITTRAAAQRAQEEADALIRTIIEASPAIFLVSRVSDGTLLYAPPFARDTFGDVQSTRDLFVGPSRRDAFLAELRARGQVDDFPVLLRAAEGDQTRHGRISARPADYRGEAIIVSAIRDVTEQLAMEEDLRRERERAFQNEKLSSLGEMLAGIAHELNNPLSVVAGYAHMLQEAEHPPAVARPVAEIVTAADRCVRIVRTFLAMANQKPMRRNMLDVNELVQAAVEAVLQGADEVSTEIRLDLAENLPPAEGDEDQIIQVFVNLIVNALHAMADTDAPRLLIATSERRGTIVASFSDNGPGIPPEVVSRIFEPFFTTKPLGSGTGIGLTFSARIVEGHRGRLEYAPSAAGGATFTVALPVETTAAHALSPDDDMPRTPAP